VNVPAVEGTWQTTWEPVSPELSVAPCNWIWTLAFALPPLQLTEAAYKLLSRCEVLRELKRYPEALADAQEAVTELEALASSSNDQAKTELSLAYFRLGNVKFSQNRIGDALNFHREALRLREEQHARHPSNLLAVRNYQGSLTRVGEILLAAKQYRSAESKFDLALAVGNDLTKQMASDVYMSADLAKAYYGKGLCALRSDRDAAAAASLRQSLQIWRDASKRSPLDPGLTAALRNCEETITGSPAIRSLVF